MTLDRFRLIRNYYETSLTVCPKEHVGELLMANAALEERCRGLELAQFESAFTMKLKDLGFDERFLEEYRDHKMAHRDLKVKCEAQEKRIAELETALVIEQEARLFYFNKLSDTQILKKAKDTELERLKTCLAHLLASHQQCWADGGTLMKWEDVPVVKEAQANLKEKLDG